ncbi:pantothenate transporter liz1 [Truncatella angustata]|uniref:Pantothenate transporter liz1 n=1 Tax=Truncatella angustata TaxID=152316 RepID=A0A9P8RKG6_9PEZI|nr:pantothenate transporter liz1 [Truncatella angustata]KAH6644925.1 pantothenate transporter liz1 [Truncatella angustata]
MDTDCRSKSTTIVQRVRVFMLGDEAQSKEERWLVQKLDFFILVYCCLSYFFNYLDRAAFANAYVAGLKEDIHLEGSNYNVVLAMFTAGSVIGQIPHGVIIQKIAPRIWLPSMVLVWAGLTMCTAACTTYAQLCVVRFLQGLAEASTYSGTIYIIGSWYKPREIAKRTAIFTASGQAGSMFAGIMMTAIYNGMGGYSLKGWQWVFLINGIITCPIAVMGFFYFPDTPELTRAPWLNKSERQLALLRLPPKKADGHDISPWSLAARTLSSPALYILCLFAVVTGALEAFVVQNLFLLWLKYHQDHFSQTQINTNPLGIQAVGIVSNFLAAVHIDATGRRVPMGIVVCVFQLTSAVILLIPSAPFAATFFAYYLSGTSYMVNPVSFGWANIICQRGGDDAVRAIILYCMNAASTCLYTFWGIALYPASDAPYWKRGSIAMIVVVFAMLVMVWVVHRLDEKTLAQYPDTAVRDLPEDSIGDDTILETRSDDELDDPIGPHQRLLMDFPDYRHTEDPTRKRRHASQADL